MRPLFLTLTLLFLGIFQVAEACCDHGEHTTEVESTALETSCHDASNRHQHGDHTGPCNCVCHQQPQQTKTTAPSSRFELDPVSEVIISEKAPRTKLSTKPLCKPLLERFTSLPPPTAAERCSQHCRFLL